MYCIDAPSGSEPAVAIGSAPSAAHLRALIEQASDGIFIADSEGRYTFANQAGCRMLGYAREQIVGKTIFDLIPPEDAGRLLESKQHMLEGGTHIADWRLRRSDGSWAAVEVSAKILPDGQWQGIVRDISERKAHQARNDALLSRLEAERRLLQGIIDILPVGLWLADEQGRITSSNRAGDAIWRGSRYVGLEQYDEYKAWWVETGEPIAPEEWGIARAIRLGETSRSELIRIQCFDGSFKTIINWAAPIRSESGAVTGAVAVNEDVTSLMHTQQQLRTAVRDREDILAIVAHDLRNPLTSIMMIADAIARHATPIETAEPIVQMVATLQDSAERMSGLVDDLLAIAAAQGGGRSMLKLAPTAVAALIARAAEAALTLFEAKSLRLELAIAPELPALTIDADRILRVLANLLDNALKFTRSPGRVLLSAEATAAGVRFAVANSGDALASDALNGMFEPFWQAAHGDRRGAGLGLAICRSIVEAHGGTIWAEPAQGERVRVCFILPRTAAAP